MGHRPVFGIQMVLMVLMHEVHCEFEGIEDSVHGMSHVKMC